MLIQYLFVFWSALHKAAGLENSSPILAFYVTYTMFVHHWKSTHTIKDTVENEGPNDMLTYDEQSALWYVGGYVIRKISDRIIKVCMENANELLLVLETFKESDELNKDDDGDDDIESSRDWFDMINRGGLTRCTNDFYSFICNVELIVKTLLSPDIQTFDVQLGVQVLKLNTSICESWATLTEPIEQAEIKS